MDKLYLIVREDLDPCQQAVQAAHALAQFFVDYPQQAVSWAKGSNTLALLAASGEPELRALVEKAEGKDHKVSPFYEPDRGNEMTAIALEPKAKTLVRKYPLALKMTSPSW